MFVNKEANLFLCHWTKEWMNKIGIFVSGVLLDPGDPFFFLLLEFTRCFGSFKQTAGW